MSGRKILTICLIMTIIIIPIAQLSFGFYYLESTTLCPFQKDLMLLMSMGGVFQAIFFAAAIAFVYTITPAQYKTEKKLTAAQVSAKGSNGAMQLLIGSIMCIFAACAIVFVVLINSRIYGNYKLVQYTDTKLPTYCLSTIFSGAFGFMIASYVAFILFFILAAVLLLGIGIEK
ncbi:unnamed protein product [Adineta steineri]|uniref:Uncharacterized protein n=1 Tax=Adineta steineri TaxID=433720 RepID=A0A819QV40_9BILA|nr:unnamed protein product [Adineta steineri]CAF4034599.1 unnamed protein product [Adineta steineri]